MKEYTDADIVVRIDGASDLLATAKKVVMAVRGVSGTVVKDCQIDGDAAYVHLFPEDTNEIGVGRADVEVTILSKDNVQSKTSNMSMLVTPALLREVLDASAE